MSPSVHDEAETASQFSEATNTTTQLSSNVPTKIGSNAAIFTCLACHVAFHGAEHQREHYKSDWHRYNLKRKVADLPPVTQEAFALRLKASFQGSCIPCGKSYSTDNAYANHLISKKHKDAEATYEKKKRNAMESAAQDTTEASESVVETSETTEATSSSSTLTTPTISIKPTVPWRVQLAQAQDQAELEKLLDSKVANPHASNTLTVFFVLTRRWRLRDYYDFSSTWENGEGGEEVEEEEGDDEEAVEEGEGEGEEWEDVDERDEYLASKTQGITSLKMKPVLPLPSGRTVLHRSQNPHSVYNHRRQMGVIPVRTAAPSKDSLAIVSLAGRYAALGALPIHTIRAEMALRKEAKSQNIETSGQVGVKMNKSTMNRHFRSQIGFD
ncbi:hypothetical protein BC829DRAFT_399408 [Chytridium lagenaria]|nr:hypothetical protein BC829DRAFT_399408 [Chytridium lagenaria]